MARDKLDRYYTKTDNDWAIEVLHNELKKGQYPFECGQRILEPCCGKGHISNYFKRKGHDVFTNDIDPNVEADTYENFLTPFEDNYFRDFTEFDWIITNPPFYISSKERASDFLRMALKMNQNVAFLMRLTFLEPCKDRRDILQDTPPQHIKVIHPRISFTGDGQTDFVTLAWFIWSCNFSGKRSTIDYYSHKDE